MTEYNLFCWAEDYNDENSFQQKRYRAFNKEVGEERYSEILSEVRKILKDLKLELNENSWSEEWKKVTTEQWEKILAMPEADKEIIENIIGYKLETETIETFESGEIIEICKNGKKIKCKIC